MRKAAAVASRALARLELEAHAAARLVETWLLAILALMTRVATIVARRQLALLARVARLAANEARRLGRSLLGGIALARRFAKSRLARGGALAAPTLCDVPLFVEEALLARRKAKLGRPECPPPARHILFKHIPAQPPSRNKKKLTP